MPEVTEYLWHWFLRLSKRRGGGFGPAPLTHSGMRDFFHLAGIRPSAWEIELLEELDDLYLQIQADEDRAKRKKAKTAAGKAAKED